MYYGHVVGHATSTVQHQSLQGQKMLVVRALGSDGRRYEGDPVLVVDRLGAGLGDIVIITSDGIATRELVGQKNSPVRWSTIAIVDGGREKDEG